TAGTYTVTATNACGQSDASIAIDVTPLPIASASGPATACPGQPITLTASGGDAYLWSTGASGSVAEAAGPGSYSVTVSNSCGSNQATVTVLPGAAFAPSFTADTTAGCAPLCARFTAVPLDGAVFAWSTSDGATGTGTSFEHCFAAGAHDVTL
ncbi:MAG: hypothetical protein ACK4L7_08230, partial [Flavobacteriales bacterium]